MEGQKEPVKASDIQFNPGPSVFPSTAPPPPQAGEIPGSTLPHAGIYHQPPPAYHNNGFYQQNPQQVPPPQNIRVIHTNGILGQHPVNTTCWNCNANIITRTTSTTSSKQCLIGIVLAAVGLWCCACIPCCLDEWNEVNHYCPNCNVLIGKNHQDC